MKPVLRIGFAAAALGLTLGACQGSFGSSGTAAPGGMTPPLSQNQGQMNPTAGGMPSPSALPSGSAPEQNVSYPIAQASSGLKCPEQNGFSCTLYFNMTDAQATALDTPSPGPRTKGSSPSPSASPSPSPSPSASASGSASPSASPSAPPQIALALAAMPKNAPAMVNPDTKAVATIPLVTLRLSTTDTATFDGQARAEFTLPKEQVGGRGFAIQLFHETKKKLKRTDDFVGSYKQSKLNGSTLVFSFAAPKFQVKKGETWLLVLYGDELPSASASPSASSSPGASASAEASASPTASVSPSAAPSPLISASIKP